VANHLRRQIREAVGTAVTGLATTSTRVFQSRVYPVQTAELPCLLVYSRSETSEVVSIHAPKMLERKLTLEIVAIAKAVADLDDTLDQICKEVETALAMPVAGLAGLAKDINLVSTEYDLEGVSEKPTGSATLIYEIGYFNLENAPDTAH
jgi:hypothetical protein